jgi:hypothetical protein
VFKAEMFENKVTEKEMATNTGGAGLFDNTHGNMQQWLGNCQFHADDMKSLLRQLNTTYGQDGVIRWFSTRRGAERWLAK